MQSTSKVPLYYHARSANEGGSGSSSRPFSEKHEKIIANVDKLVGPYKNPMKNIMLNQEATFRNQVQEMHRLYRRQKELMDEMKAKEISAQHLQSQTSESVHSSSQAHPEISQPHPPATSWILGDSSNSIQGPSFFVVESSQERKTDAFRRNSYHEVEFLSSSSKEKEKRIVDLGLSAPVSHDDQGKLFKMINFSESPNIQRASGSDLSPVKTEESRKTKCFIDLNEPIILESFSSSSSAWKEAIPESAVPKRIKLTNYDDSSEGINSSVAIDLNSVPVSETEINVENVSSTNKDDAVKNEKCVVNTETKIDLNKGVEDENPPSVSSPVLQTKPAEEVKNLEGPVSPENEEGSPPRGNSEDTQTQVETPAKEPEIFAAETLVIFRSDCANPAPLCCFAEIVSSAEDDLENQIMKLNNDAAENTLDFPHVENEKESGTPSRGKKRRRGVKDVETIEGSVGASPLKRKAAWKKASPKPRKYPKRSPSDVVKKSVSSILKQPATRSKQVIQHIWGKTMKREGVRRRRVTASEFVGFLAEVN